MEEIKKTYPKLKLIDHDEFARLHYPDIFPTSNKPRLYREVSDKILQFFYDFHYAFLKLPNSYKFKILTNRNFHEFINTMISHDYVLNKSKEEERNFTFLVYNNFFHFGITGLVETMPAEFRQYLNGELRPILSLMGSIASYSIALNPKSTIPRISTPEILGKSYTQV